MKTYLSPLGFDTSHVTSLIVRCGIEQGDRICLIRPGYGEDARAERAIKTVKEIIQQISSGISVEILKLNTNDLEAMVLMLLDEICALTPPNLPDGKLTVNLSGGPREVLVALTAATVMLAPRIQQCAIFSDIERETRIYRPARLPILIDETALRILADIDAHGPASISEIAGRVRVSESTASRVCAKLASEELVQVQQEKKNKTVTVKFNGKIVLKVRKGCSPPAPE